MGIVVNDYPQGVFKVMQEEIKELQEEAIFRETLLDMMRSKNKKLEQRVVELEAGLEYWRDAYSFEYFRNKNWKLLEKDKK